ncbi:MAG: Xaa-Pro peptidase family protein [Candidatus Omnitrophota bacterium]
MPQATLLRLCELQLKRLASEGRQVTSYGLYIKRHKRLLALLKDYSLDALLVKKKQNIHYLTGSKGEDSILIVSSKKPILITDSRYKEEYSKNPSLYTVKTRETSSIYKLAQSSFIKNKWKAIAFESDSFSVSEFLALKKGVKNINFIPKQGLVQSLRMIKDKDEIKIIKKACKDGAHIMSHALRCPKPGMTEERIKAMIESYMAKMKIKKAGFDIIIASGRNSSMPHASVTKRILRKKDMFLIDLGTLYKGYNSDLTRARYLGRIDRKYLKLYNIVLDAQLKAIEAIKPGIKANILDKISRNYISYRGLGKYFVHSLGHGIGLETHELPRISHNSNDILEEGMVITIEPGIYIPGWGGIRIEDDILVTNKGREVLTKGVQKKLCK